MPKGTIAPGLRYGKLLALEIRPREEWRGHNSLWRCQCDCGQVVDVSSTSLAKYKKLGIGSCGCGRGAGSTRSKGLPRYNQRLPGNEGLWRTRIRAYKADAPKRGRKWLLTDEHAKLLMSSRCQYCGDPPGPFTIARGPRREPLASHGIDRVDNSLGYTNDNCVPCCKTCNLLKRDQSVKEFLDWISSIHITSEARKTTGWGEDDAKQVDRSTELAWREGLQADSR